MSSLRLNFRWFSGRLQLEADRHTQHIRSRDTQASSSSLNVSELLPLSASPNLKFCLTHTNTHHVQVRALSSFLDMEGFDRPPFSALQLQSFHCQVRKLMDQESDTVDRMLVRRCCCEQWLMWIVFSAPAMFPLCFSRSIWTAGGAATEGTAEAAVHGRDEGQEDRSGEDSRA